MSTLKATNIKNESSASNNIVLNSGGGVVVNNGVTLGTGTTISSPASDTFTVSTNGSERVRVDSSGNINVDSGGVYYDAGNNRLGVGSTAPSTALQVVGTGRFSSGTEGITAYHTGSIGWIETSGNNATPIAFANGGLERARIDSSGRLGLGTSSPARGPLHINSSTADTYFHVTNSTTGSSASDGFTLHQSGNETLLNNRESGNMRFYTAGSERMRITSGGFSKISNTGSYNDPTGTYHEISSNNNNSTPLWVSHVGASGQQYGILITTDNDQNDTTRYFLKCRGATTERAVIRSNGGLANYQANDVNLSDRNAKKDISPAAGTWDCIKEWEIVNYRYKDQPEDADLSLGVIAQQVAESCPEVIAVFQEAREATETEPAQEERLGVKEQQMYWMAIKALQEAQVRIEQLEAKVAALETA